MSFPLIKLPCDPLMRGARKFQLFHQCEVRQVQVPADIRRIRPVPAVQQHRLHPVRATLRQPVLHQTNFPGARMVQEIPVHADVRLPSREQRRGTGRHPQTLSPAERQQVLLLGAVPAEPPAVEQQAVPVIDANCCDQSNLPGARRRHLSFGCLSYHVPFLFSTRA